MICIDSLKNQYLTPIENKFIDLFVGAEDTYFTGREIFYTKNRHIVYNIINNNKIIFDIILLDTLFNQFNKKLDINTLQKLTKKHIGNNLIVKQL